MKREPQREPRVLRIPLISLLAIGLLGIPACTQSPDCSRPEIFCAALVTDTQGLQDYGLNQATWVGLTASKANGVANEIAVIESVDSRDYEKNIAYLINTGYDVIVTSGAGMRAVTLRSADLYPATVFIGMNQPDEESVPNFIAVTFAEDQMGFLAGALAAQLTRTNIIGALCETSGIDAMWRYCEGFQAGAESINPNVDVSLVYRDSGSSEKFFLDTDWGTENAQLLIQHGADVLFAVGGETGAAALRTASLAGIQAIGAERDQRAALAEKGAGVVTSVVGQGSLTVQEVLRRVKAGDQTDAELNPIGYVSLEGFAPQNVIAKMEEILAGLQNGEIKTNVTPKKP